MAFYFGELEIAMKILKPLNQLGQIDTCYLTTSIRIFFSGLTLSLMVRKTGKRKYKVKAKAFTEEMQKIMKSRGLNSLHRYLMMQANLEACVDRGNRENQVKEAFDKAISAASRAGFLHDAALGNELVGEYFLSIGNSFWCKHYFTKAYELYSEWGALAKVKLLKAQRSEYIDAAPTSRDLTRGGSSTISGRHWLSGEEIQIHKQVNLDLLSGQNPFKDLPADNPGPTYNSVKHDTHTVVSSLTTPTAFHYSSDTATLRRFPLE